MKTFVLKRADIHRGNLILINKNHAIKVNELEIIDNLVPIDRKNKNHLLNKNMAKALNNIFSKINSEDRIVPVSGFRSKEEQTRLYKNSVIENGVEFTQKFVAQPDESEHQSGLAIDLGKNKENINFICPEFPYSGVFNKFRKESKEWGFIQRYKANKESITGISNEPWHFRYVGYPHSAIIEEKDFALEEYHDFIREYTSEDNPYEYRCKKCLMQVFFIKATENIQTFNIEDHIKYEVSGNNSDGFIITLFKRVG